MANGVRTYMADVRLLHATGKFPVECIKAHCAGFTVVSSMLRLSRRVQLDGFASPGLIRLNGQRATIVPHPRFGHPSSLPLADGRRCMAITIQSEASLLCPGIVLAVNSHRIVGYMRNFEANQHTRQVQ